MTRDFIISLFLVFSVHLSNSRPDRDYKIYNGYEVAPGANQFVVFIRIEDHTAGRNINLTCTGTILSKTWIISAAHCVKKLKRPGSFEETNRDPSEIEVVAMTRNIVDYEEGYQVRKVIAMYNSPTSHIVRMTGAPNGLPQLINDIVLLKLATPLNISQDVPIPLTRDENLLNGAGAFASGWGFDTNWRRPATMLKEIHFDTVFKDENVCWKEWFDALGSMGTPDNTICTTKKDGSVCFGDSGGPLYVNHTRHDGNTIAVQIGITVTVDPLRVDCMYAGEKTVIFARLSKFCDWITETTGNAGVCEAWRFE